MKLFNLIATFYSLFLLGCQNITLTTNAGSYIVNQTVLNSLEEYSSDQNAIESGANLIAKVTGEYCLTENINPSEELINNSSDNYEINRAKAFAYEDFKSEVLVLNGNVFVTLSCYKVKQAQCSFTFHCRGNAYKNS
ncbi:hypothetical protein KO527_11925 [Pseudoalteromonas sp. C2R02]|uniref:hypothetical protein n=1 Tax=Pseudoalteromonas sp. C2R02 TaxID=2841565 RepID=UPI001C0829E7|nr:hypothetical protein [Pseudoalteromonas sp. C2R02]MBU2970060.1 hypothetical protein [Pseudoalteromonas sp. C2R02]